MTATRYRWIAATLIGVAAIGACGGAGSTLSADEYAAQIVAATNAARADHGLPPLAESACARDAGLDRAAALVGQDELTHADLAPVHDACHPPAGLTAENLSRTAAAPADVVDAWLASPGHANNLLSPEATAIGVGCVPDDGFEPGALLCAQIFLG